MHVNAVAYSLKHHPAFYKHVSCFSLPAKNYLCIWFVLWHASSFQDCFPCVFPSPPVHLFFFLHFCPFARTFSDSTDFLLKNSRAPGVAGRVVRGCAIALRHENVKGPSGYITLNALHANESCTNDMNITKDTLTPAPLHWKTHPYTSCTQKMFIYSSICKSI